MTIIRFLPMLCSVLLLCPLHASADDLQQCYRQQVAPLQGRLVEFSYRESSSNLYHSPEPWQVLAARSTGRIWCDASRFYQSDTADGAQGRIARTHFTPTELLLQRPWSRELLAVTPGRRAAQCYETARYSPILLIDHLARAKSLPESTDERATVYADTMYGTIVRLVIRRADCVVEQVTTTEHHAMWGDISTTITYGDYTRIGQLLYPQRVSIRKVQGITDSVRITAVGFAVDAPSLLERPAGYVVREEQESEKRAVVVPVADHLYAVEFPHARSRAMLVEFDTFLVAIDVPLDSDNGELLLQRADSLAPGKPVRYYAFGHHHPWYLGGVRPFIHRGATVLCRSENSDYVRYIATAPHALKPDSLHLQPRPLRVQMVGDSTVISDGTLHLHIYHIGAASGHTNDYLIFYLPSHRVVIEGDLAWIPVEGTPQKAGRTQVGLYNAIQRLGIDVQTIVQNWPIDEKAAYKTSFTFRELEESVQVK